MLLTLLLLDKFARTRFILQDAEPDSYRTSPPFLFGVFPLVAVVVYSFQIFTNWCLWRNAEVVMAISIVSFRILRELLTALAY